jgi:hypothetical protein
MRSGALLLTNNRKSGSGLPYVVVHVKSWRTPWVTAAPTLAETFIANCLHSNVRVKPIVISGFEVGNPQALRGNGYSGFSTSKAYKAVFPKDTHQALGKEAGQTNHVERWNNTLRQRKVRFVRKTLSFSKSLTAHHMFVKWFIFHYNLDCFSSCT